MRRKKSSTVLENMIEIGFVIALFGGLFLLLGYVHTSFEPSESVSLISLGLIGAFMWLLTRLVDGTPKKKRKSRSKSKTRTRTSRYYPASYVADATYDDSF